MKPFDERAEEATEAHVYKVLSNCDVVYADHKQLLKVAYLSGAQWSRTETIREMLSLLSSDEAIKLASDGGLKIMESRMGWSWPNPKSVAKWLADKFGVKE